MPSIISCGGQVPQLPRRKSPCGDVPWIMPPHGIPHSPRLPVMTINGMRPDEHGNLDISIPVVDTNIIQGSNNPVSGGAVWTGLEGKANAIHTHLISEIDNLQATLNGKSDVGHRHTIQEIDQLIDTLGNYTPKLDYNILAGEVLKNQGAITSLQTEVASKADKSHTHDISGINNLRAALESLDSSIATVHGEMATKSELEKKANKRDTDFGKCYIMTDNYQEVHDGAHCIVQSSSACIALMGGGSYPETTIIITFETLEDRYVGLDVDTPVLMPDGSIISNDVISAFQLFYQLKFAPRVGVPYTLTMRVFNKDGSSVAKFEVSERVETAMDVANQAISLAGMADSAARAAQATADNAATKDELKDGLTSKANKVHTHKVSEIEDFEERLEKKQDRLQNGFGQSATIDSGGLQQVYVKDGMSVFFDWANVAETGGVMIQPLLDISYHQNRGETLTNRLSFRYVASSLPMEYDSSKTVNIVFPNCSVTVLDIDSNTVKNFDNSDPVFRLTFSNTEDFGDARLISIDLFKSEKENTPSVFVRVKKIDRSIEVINKIVNDVNLINVNKQDKIKKDENGEFYFETEVN